MRAVLDGTIPVPDVDFEPASAPADTGDGRRRRGAVVAPEPIVLRRLRPGRHALAWPHSSR